MKARSETIWAAILITERNIEKLEGLIRLSRGVKRDEFEQELMLQHEIRQKQKRALEAEHENTI